MLIEQEEFMHPYISSESQASTQFYNVRHFGAKGNSKVKDTEAIQQTITFCAKHGGGTVVFPPGIYLTGSIHLCSNLTLYIDLGATLLFSSDFGDYPPVRTRWEGVECYGFSPLVYGSELENISVIGRGTLDGQGEAWWNELRRRRQEGITQPESEFEKQLAQLNPGYESAGSGGGGREIQFLRPPLVQLINCRNVLLEGLTHQNSPFWNTHLVYCDNVVIQNVCFKNPSDAPNTDGLDIDSCRNVRVSNCFFDVGDDCLCLKSGMDEDGKRVGKPTENVTISNCIMLHGHGGVVIGSEIAGNIRNVTISNCQFFGTDRGIRIKARRGRGGTVEDIRVNNIIMQRVLSPIVMNLFYRCGASPSDAFLFETNPQSVTEETPIVRNISLSNITARDVRAAAGFLHGLPEMPIQNVRFHDIVIETTCDPQEQGGEPAMVFGLESMVGKGILGKYLKGVQFHHVRVETRQEEGLRLEESQEIEIHGFIMRNLHPESAAIVLKQVEKAFAHGCYVWSSEGSFVQLRGDRTTDILFHGNSLGTEGSSSQKIHTIVHSWAGKVADSILTTYPNPKTLHNHHPGEWCYQNGFFVNALFALWQKTKCQDYWQYLMNWVDVFVTDDGVIDEQKYKREKYNLDNILPGRLLISLYQETQDEKYRKAALYLMEQLKKHPRTSEGGYWHKQIYPYQMWLDGIYMAELFSVEFARTFDAPHYFDEAAHQIILIHSHTYDPKTGLLYHGWDETKTQVWAHPERGTSPEFWGRAIGWYTMALAECLDILPEKHPRRKTLVEIFQNLANSVAHYQDPQTGLWYQVLDKGDRPDNWHETSCTAMFAYAFARGVRKGYLDDSFREQAEQAYQGLIDHYVYLDENGYFYLTDTVKVGSLCSKADYEYYVTTERRVNDFKGVSAFLYASLEMEA
jgi:rhamnogalacturonyl hydrolase YesR/polygalacturonase